MGKEEGLSADSWNGKLKGMPLDRLGDAWDYAKVYISDKPNLVAIEDLESGYPQIMTKEQAKQMAEMWEACIPKPIDGIESKIMFFGTGGNIENNKDWSDLFKIGND